MFILGGIFCRVELPFNCCWWVGAVCCADTDRLVLRGTVSTLWLCVMVNHHWPVVSHCRPPVQLASARHAWWLLLMFSWMHQAWRTQHETPRSCHPSLHCSPLSPLRSHPTSNSGSSSYSVPVSPIVDVLLCVASHTHQLLNDLFSF